MQRRILLRCDSTEEEDCSYELGIFYERAELALKLSEKNQFIVNPDGMVKVKIESDGL